jgi:hypothetical protein
MPQQLSTSAAETEDQNYKDNDDPDELIFILAETDTANAIRHTRLPPVLVSLHFIQGTKQCA